MVQHSCRPEASITGMIHFADAGTTRSADVRRLYFAVRWLVLYFLALWLDGFQRHICMACNAWHYENLAHWLDGNSAPKGVRRHHFPSMTLLCSRGRKIRSAATATMIRSVAMPNFILSTLAPCSELYKPQARCACGGIMTLR